MILRTYYVIKYEKKNDNRKRALWVIASLSFFKLSCITTLAVHWFDTHSFDTRFLSWSIPSAWLLFFHLDALLWNWPALCRHLTNWVRFCRSQVKASIPNQVKSCCNAFCHFFIDLFGDWDLLIEMLVTCIRGFVLTVNFIHAAF